MESTQGDVEGEQFFLLLKGRDAMTLTIFNDQPKCEQCKHLGYKHTPNGLKERASRPTNFLNSLEYLLYVGALDFLKVHKTNWYGLDLTSSH